MLPFQPSGTTKLCAASSSVPTPTQVCTGSEQTMYLANPCTVALYVAIGTSSVTVGFPSTGTPAVAMCIPPSGSRAIGAPGANSWLAAMTSAGSAAPGLFATPGYGS